MFLILTNFRNTFSDQMASSLCLFRNQLPLISILVPLLIFYGLWGFWFLTILFTSSVLILSISYLAFSNKKPLLVENSEKEEIFRFDQEEALSPMEEDVSELKPSPEIVTQKKGGVSQSHDGYSVRSLVSVSSKLEPEETITPKGAQESDGIGQIHDYSVVRSLDSLSESESIDCSSTSEDSEVDWLFQDSMGQSSVCSDGSISDEDSFIEIALPSGHYVTPKKEEPIKFNSQQKLLDLSAQPMFLQRSLMEFLADMNEMNEEENLIEIDISMGSIKCSRFEIEA